VEATAKEESEAQKRRTAMIQEAAEPRIAAEEVDD